MRVPLRAKFFVVVILGVLVPMVIYLVYESSWRREELSRVFIQQGRVVFNQILITRRWLSRNGGVYVYKRPFVQPSLYLDQADTSTVAGDPITLRSPELVTRELSELSEEQGLSRFRIVSLEPINPANTPDAWEAQSLAAFAQGARETSTQSGQGRQERFRYMAPLFTEESCLHCHQEYKYRVGQVRGAISIEFPVGEMLENERGHLWRLAALTGLIVLAIVGLVWLGTRDVILGPLARISRAVGAMAEGDYDYPLTPRSRDELSDLARAVLSMRSILKDYNLKLREEVAARTRELEGMRAHAQRERDYLIHIFERMADGVCVLSETQYQVEYVNPSLAAVFGPAKNQPCYRVFFQRALPCPDCPLPGQDPDSISRREIVMEGGARVFEVLSSELRNPDGSRSWLLVFRDITERKRLEKALLEMNQTLEAKVKEQTTALLEQERLATLGEISAGMAHEIRNPLSAIMSGISLLESERRTLAERAHILKLIKREADRLNSSLTDFLLFARPQEPKKVRIDLGGLLREIAQLIEEDPELRREITVRLELADLPIIWFDDYQLRQVVWNVALNALQAMEGKGELTIRTRPGAPSVPSSTLTSTASSVRQAPFGSEPQGRRHGLSPSKAVEPRLRPEGSTPAEGSGWFQILIEDTGPGIPEEIQDRIYDPFFSTKREGTGLGLSIVRRIVQAHGGTIAFECGPGRGCAFIITAPIGKEETAT